MIRKLVGVAVLAGLVGGFTLGDLWVRQSLEHRIEEETIKHVDGVGHVTADVSGFPLVARAIIGSALPHVVLRLDDVRRGGVTVQHMVIDVHDLGFDRGAVFSGDVRVVSISSATVEADVSDAAISEVVGTNVTFLPGRVRVDVGGRTVEGGLTVKGRDIVMTPVGSGELRVALPEQDLLPCQVQAQVLAHEVRLRCTLTELPRVVLDAIGEGTKASK